jgi:catechol 2,3-dioxygenase-like lactoylglutathione lyase family enzyme
MLDHIGFTVANFAEAKAFYAKALAPLGLGLMMEVTKEQTGCDEHAGFGRDNKPFFWIGTGDKAKGGVHIALAAGSRQQVDDFYAAAIEAGGRDNGKPGLRPHYHPNYYAAFILDRDGNNIEAVCHAPG